ncbi:MAG TPA: hypothetical protein VL899_02935 [Alphaproteobacteria bacterium]|jgi:hypothetical protein|nr:hypothetical protein [Alphaproteobacteria bacterium]
MHVLTFMYPSAPGETFKFDHYFKTHLPMGAGLAKKFLDIDVSKMIIQSVRGPEQGGIPAPYFVLCHVILKSKEEADRLAGIFAFDEAAKRLSEDWPKYTPLAPSAMVSEWTVLEDMDALRARFRDVLEPEYAASAA